MRGPNDWPDAQRSFSTALANGASAPAVDVRIRWWTKHPSPLPAFVGLPAAIVGTVLGLLAFRRWVRGGPQGTWVAVWLPGAAAGATADLVIKVDGDALPGPEGAGNARLLGEAAPNGALALEIGDRRVLPTFNPMTPIGLLRKVAGTRP